MDYIIDLWNKLSQDIRMLELSSRISPVQK